MGVKITSVRLLSVGPHQLEFGARTVFTPTCRSLIMNGPVPFALEVAKFYCLALMLAGAAALFFSAQTLLIMYVEVVCIGRIGFCLSMMKSTVRSSTFFTSVTVATV